MVKIEKMKMRIITPFEKEEKQYAEFLHILYNQLFKCINCEIKSLPNGNVILRGDKK